MLPALCSDRVISPFEIRNFLLLSGFPLRAPAPRGQR
jgi:hypothetical protein